MSDIHLADWLTGETRPSLQLENLLDQSLDLAREALAADRWSLMLWSEEEGALVINRARGLNAAVMDNTRARLGDGVAGWVALTRQSILVGADHDYPDLVRPNRASYNTQSFVSVPLLCGCELMGVLNAADKRDGAVFSERDLLLLQAIASFAAKLLRAQQSTRELEDGSLRDPVTRLGNRQYFDWRLSQELARSRRHNLELALLVIDVDHFSQVYEQCGRERADRVLQRIGRYIEQVIRRSDVAIRYDTDEFAVILPQTSEDAAQMVAQRLVNTVAEQSLPEIADQPVTLTLSAGITCYPTLALDEEQMVNQAEAALYSAKTSAGQRVQVWREPTDRLLEAQRLGVPYLVAPVEMITPDIARLIPAEVARRYCCVPVGFERGKLTVAVLDPTDEALLETIASVTHLTIHPVISGQAEILAALNRLAELWRKPVVADVVIRKTSGGGREVAITLKRVAGGADAGRVVGTVREECRAAGGQVRRAEANTILVHVSAVGCSRLLRALHNIDCLLIESVRTENRRRPGQ